MKGTRRETQNTLERLHFSSGLKLPRRPPRGAGGGGLAMGVTNDPLGGKISETGVPGVREQLEVQLLSTKTSKTPQNLDDSEHASQSAPC